MFQWTRLCVAILAIIFFTQVAHAGWSSNGGELIKDGQNPWFLQNRIKVTYCILHDPEVFHTSADLRHVIEDTWKYWQQEFFKTGTNPFESDLRIATQTIYYQPECGDNVDIRFQFGVLTAEQRQHIAAPQEYVAIGVRTFYDQVQMMGKGFIYVAPDSGPLKPNLERMRSEPWQFQDGIILKLVLAHELGHVFGLRHQGGAGHNLMDERFPEEVISKDFSQGSGDGSIYLPPYFVGQAKHVELTIHDCFDFPDRREFMQKNFGLRDGEQCVFSHAKIDASHQWTLFATTAQGSERVLGSFSLNGPVASAYASQIYLPPGQQVVRNYDRWVNASLTFEKTDATGIFTPVDQAVLPPVAIYSRLEGGTDHGSVRGSIHAIGANQENMHVFWVDSVERTLKK